MSKKTWIALLLVICLLLTLVTTACAAQKLNPTDGQKYVKPDYKTICPFRVTADDAANYYVYLKYIGVPQGTEKAREKTNGAVMKANCESDTAFYVKANGDAQLKMPIGVYEVYIAVGQDFYGPKELFGPDTKCYASTGKLTFYVTDEQIEKDDVTGIWLEIEPTLFTPENGLTEISIDEFPTK